ncbi:MAG: preprotein translocase subunit SecE [Gemmatimonadota bacterium]|nr:preprotein translocase subunit SecE [Candidatus Palauibacterales bacterium]
MTAVLERLDRVRKFTVEVQAEMKKVTWPDWLQLRNATGVIIVFVLIVAAIIGLMDLVFRKIVDLILGFLGA